MEKSTSTWIRELNGNDKILDGLGNKCHTYNCLSNFIFLIFLLNYKRKENNFGLVCLNRGYGCSNCLELLIDH